MTDPVSGREEASHSAGLPRSWYHATTRARFKVGQMIRPGREVGRYSNLMMVPGVSTERELLRSGRTVDMHEVVWVCEDADEAAGWAAHSLLKATPADIRQQPAGGIAVYEVEPVGLDFPAEKHSATEAVCDRAVVVREVVFDAFPQGLCDYCGDSPATVGLGSDLQLCANCAEEEQR